MAWHPMASKWRQGMWLLFWAGNAATWLADRTLWIVDPYELILAMLCLATMAVAIAVAVKSKFEKSTLGVLACGLLVGQWCLVQKILMRVYWTMGGFAP